MAAKKITATGTKGFLKWLQQYDPRLYAGVAPLLPSKLPQLFSQFEAAGGLKGLACRRGMRGLGQTGDTGFTGGTGATFSGGTGSTSFGTGSTSWGSTAGWGGTATTGSTGAGATATTGSTGPGSTSSSSVPIGAGAAAAAGQAIDVSDAANPGPLSSPDANSLAQIANDVASATQSVGQAVVTAGAINTQLTRAQSGLTPLPISNPSLLPVEPSDTFSVSSWFGNMSATDWLWVAAAAAGGLYLLA
jgi:hypothetical protein